MVSLNLSTGNKSLVLVSSGGGHGGTGPPMFLPGELDKRAAG